MTEKVVVTPQKLRENVEKVRKQKEEEREAHVKQFMLNEVPKVEEKLMVASCRGETGYDWRFHVSSDVIILTAENYFKTAGFTVVRLNDADGYFDGFRISW